MYDLQRYKIYVIPHRLTGSHLLHWNCPEEIHPESQWWLSPNQPLMPPISSLLLPRKISFRSSTHSARPGGSIWFTEVISYLEVLVSKKKFRRLEAITDLTSSTMNSLRSKVTASVPGLEGSDDLGCIIDVELWWRVDGETCWLANPYRSSPLWIPMISISQ